MTFKMRNLPTLAEDRSTVTSARERTIVPFRDSERDRFIEMVKEIGLSRIREALTERIENDLAFLDALDGDPDLEPDECAELFLQHELRGGANVRAA